MSQQAIKSAEALEMYFYRIMLNLPWPASVSNLIVLEEAKTETAPAIFGSTLYI